MVYMYHSFLIHSSADGHLGCFHVLSIINSAAMNTGVHVSLSHLVSSVCMPRSRSTNVEFLNIYSVFRASPMLQFLKYNELKIIFMPKRHILGWPILLLFHPSQQPLDLDDNLVKARKPKWQPERKVGSNFKIPDCWDKYRIPCQKALSIIPYTAFTYSSPWSSSSKWSRVRVREYRARIRVRQSAQVQNLRSHHRRVLSLKMRPTESQEQPSGRDKVPT